MAPPFVLSGCVFISVVSRAAVLPKVEWKLVAVSLPEVCCRRAGSYQRREGAWLLPVRTPLQAGRQVELAAWVV